MSTANSTKSQIDKYNKDVKPEMMKVNPENIPDELKKRKQWIGWDWEWNKTKWSKPPVDVHGIRKSIHSKLYSFKEVMKAHNQNPSLGIGFVLTVEDNFCGIDLDDVINGDGRPNKWAKKVIKSCNSYTEISPSGSGIRIIGFGTPDTHKSPEIEVYNKARYLTITGNILAKRGH